MATLSEVARIAGVTTATVSNVLRNRHKVKPSTALKVDAAIAATGYRPNLMARALSEGKSSMVAMVLPNITNPFYPEFIRAAERVARLRNYFLMVCNTDERPDIALEYLTQIAGTLADGVLITHSGVSPNDILELSGRRVPIVMVSAETADFAPNIPQIVVNLHRAGEIAGQHLLDLGHRQMGIIVGGGLEGVQGLRFGGFKKALAEAGVTCDEKDVRYVNDSINGGYEAAHSLMTTNPRLTALFATNDLMAFGASQAMADMAISIPTDISLIGMTDIQLAQDMRPALTTVAFGIEEMATSSVNLLLDLIKDKSHKPIIVNVPDPKLVIRASTSIARVT